jgi:hypothetical protein
MMSCTDDKIACSRSYLQMCHSMALPQSTPHAEPPFILAAFSSSAFFCDVPYHNISMS